MAGSVAFWGLVLVMAALEGAMLWYTRRRRLALARDDDVLALALRAMQAAVEQHDWAQVLSESQRGLDELKQRARWLRLLRWLDGKAKAEWSERAAIQADLYLNHGLALEQLDRLSEALADYETCSVLVHKHALSTFVATLAFRRGNVLARLDRSAQAEQALQECIADLQRTPRPRLRLNAYRALAALYHGMHQAEQAMQSAEEALRLAREEGDGFSEGLMLDLQGDLALAAGRHDEALHYYELSLDVFRRQDSRTGLVMVQRDVAQVYQARGEWLQTLAWLRVCLTENERAQDVASQAQISYEMACVLIDNNELQDATHLLLRSLGLFRRAQDKAAVDRVGRTLMGLGVWMQRLATADQLTYRDIERGSKLDKEEEES